MASEYAVRSYPHVKRYCHFSVIPRLASSPPGLPAPAVAELPGIPTTFFPEGFSRSFTFRLLAFASASTMLSHESGDSREVGKGWVREQ